MANAIKSERPEKAKGGKRGRPSIYSAALAERICKKLSAGETLRQVCRGDGMPAPSTVCAWALNAEHPFYEQYARAREIGYRLMADELLEIADDGTNDWVERENKNGETYTVVDAEAVARSRIRVDTRKWLLSKALPKIYGDKIQHTGDGGAGPVHHAIEMVIVDPR